MTSMKRRRIGIYIFLDGLGAEFVRAHDFLPEFEYRLGLRTVLGGCAAAQPTILTGLLPREHGVRARFPRRNGSSAFEAARRYSWLPGFLSQRSGVRERIRDRVATELRGEEVLDHCPTRLLPEFDAVAVERFFEPGGVPSTPSIFDELNSRRLEYRVYRGDDDEHGDLLSAEEDLARGGVDFLFVALPSLGTMLMEHGSEAPLVHERLVWIQSWVRRLLEQAETSADVVELFVFSDHGTSDVHGAVDLSSEVESTFGRNGQHYLAFYDPTMARFWCADPALRGDINAFLSERTDGRPVLGEEREALGWDFSGDGCVDELFLLNEGLQLIPSFRGDRMRMGMHGYHPDSVGSEASLLGLWSPSEELRHIRDLHGLMMRTIDRLAAE